MVNRLNRHCGYFPCHKKLEDCTFCYCPFYPCADERLGAYIISKDKRKIWSCSDCNWIHNKNVVDNIFSMIRKSGFRKRPVKGRRVTKNTGVIILGHGSKLKIANDSLRALAKDIRMESEFDIVEPAFLQSCQPDLRKVIKKVVRTGCGRIVIVPFFLFMGNHVTRDIPKVIALEAKMHKRVKLIYAKNLGQDPRMANIVMDRIREVA